MLTEHVLQPTLDALNDGEHVHLRDFEGQLVELRIRYNGGSLTLCGRVTIVNGDLSCRTFISIEGATLPYDASVRRECVGKSLVYDSTQYLER